MTWMGESGEKIIQNTHQGGVNDTPDTYYDLFERHIHPVSKFQVQCRQFYLLKQEQSERIDKFVLKLSEYIRECKFPEGIQDQLLLDRVIYSNKHNDLIQKIPE